MPNTEVGLCGFCGGPCKTDEDIGWLLFPNGEKKPAHLTHVGVKDEYIAQMNDKRGEPNAVSKI